MVHLGLSCGVQALPSGAATPGTVTRACLPATSAVKHCGGCMRWTAQHAMLTCMAQQVCPPPPALCFQTPNAPRPTHTTEPSPTPRTQLNGQGCPRPRPLNHTPAALHHVAGGAVHRWRCPALSQDTNVGCVCERDISQPSAARVTAQYHSTPSAGGRPPTMRRAPTPLLMLLMDVPQKKTQTCLGCPQRPENAVTASRGMVTPCHLPRLMLGLGQMQPTTHIC
jgi:hypothetical protein